MSDDFNEFDRVDASDTVRTMLGLAIGLGAPVYNSGDPRGCYEIYAATGRMLLQLGDVTDDHKETLSSGLREAATHASVDEQAWIMRRAFDTILGE